jgi:hypothetical protein
MAQLTIGAVLVTVSSYSDYPPYTRGELFIPITWAAVECMFVASFIHGFEYSLQRWTPTGEIIAAKYKPAMVPWISMDRYYWSNPR